MKEARVAIVVLLFLLSAYVSLQTHSTASAAVSDKPEQSGFQLLKDASKTLYEGKGPAHQHRLSCTLSGGESASCSVGAGGKGIQYTSSEYWNEYCATGHCKPRERGGAAMTYDAADGYVLLFGGLADNLKANVTLSDTWTFANGTWRQLNVTGPSARLGSYTGYDYADHYVVLFGGGPYLTLNGKTYDGDTWTFAGGKWHLLATQTGNGYCAYSWMNGSSGSRPCPSPRGLGTTTYDAADGYLMIYGGFSSQTDVHSDTWTFDGGVWDNRTTSGNPPALLAPMMTYYPPGNYVVLFGGDTPSPQYQFGQVLAETFRYSHGTWIDMTSSSSSSPAGRILGAFGYDPLLKEIILFGGWNTSNGQVLEDTWSFGGQPNPGWSQIFTSPTPIAIFGPGMTGTAKTSGLFMFGGIGAGTFNSSATWTAQNSTWFFGAPPPNTTANPNSSNPTPYVVNINISPAACIGEYLNGTLIMNGASYKAPPGLYNISAINCRGYQFVSWFGTGGVTPSHPYNYSTTMALVGNGTLTAYYSVPAGLHYKTGYTYLALAITGMILASAFSGVMYLKVTRRYRGF